MKYFIDTEFIEGFYRPLFGRRRHFIDLISIGLVAEDGREYYAISNEFNQRKANQWVKENVIAKLPPMITNCYTAPEVGTVVEKNPLYKSNKQIAKEIIAFCMWPYYHEPLPNKNLPEFYGYYADYDWVLFCSLFGTMMDLPKGFPMYCRDLKQMLDEKAASISDEVIDPQRKLLWDKAPFTFNEKLNWIKSHSDYPKQTNEHNAIADAKWNFELYNFLQAI